MATLSEFQRLLSGMSAGERADVLAWAVRELGGGYPGVESQAEVCGGEACVVRTRIPVWLLERARRMGLSHTTLLHSYPTLREEDLINAWAYAQAHPGEMDAQIRDNEAA
jgi:uncharacterized protein (DUF433 family)